MSRTYAHVPFKFHKYPLTKHYNTKNTKLARQMRRKVRHALIDEEMILLVNAIAESKHLSYLVNDMYW